MVSSICAAFCIEDNTITMRKHRRFRGGCVQRRGASAGRQGFASCLEFGCQYRRQSFCRNRNWECCSSPKAVAYVRPVKMDYSAARIEGRLVDWSRSPSGVSSPLPWPAPTPMIKTSSGRRSKHLLPSTHLFVCRVIAVLSLKSRR